MQAQNDAYYPCLCSALSLSVNDLAEIGGFSDRFARDLVAGRRPWPADVCEALDLLDDDVDVMTDSLVADVEEGLGAIFVYRTTVELRAHFRAWPGRGKAGGGFAGPHRVAAIAAHEALDERGIEVSLLFFTAADAST